VVASFALLEDISVDTPHFSEGRTVHILLIFKVNNNGVDCSSRFFQARGIGGLVAGMGAGLSGFVARMRLLKLGESGVPVALLAPLTAPVPFLTRSPHEIAKHSSLELIINGRFKLALVYLKKAVISIPNSIKK
jgi:hypothetical protein